MSKTIVGQIDEIKLDVILIERRFDSTGDFAIDEKVKKKYVEKHYDSAPKTAEEAEVCGLSNYNGLMSSIPKLNVCLDDKTTVIVADIAPTRYLIGQAWRDIEKEGNCDYSELKKMSPRMANVSLLVPVKIDGEYFLLSQIKGKALGSGEILSLAVAGNVDGKYLQKHNPLVEALKNECSEELCMDLSYLDSTSFTCLLDDGAGGVNFISVAKNADINAILTAYESDTKIKLIKNEQLEVMALATLPVAGYALIPIEGGRKEAKNVQCYFPTSKGLEIRKEDRTVRPLTKNIMDYIQDKNNLNSILKKACY